MMLTAAWKLIREMPLASYWALVRRNLMWQARFADLAAIDAGRPA
jgi:hypothetical protein